MARFVALYRMPPETGPDPEAFLRAYRDTHLPLVLRTPGVTKIEVSRVRRTVTGEPALLLMAVLHFSDPEFQAAMASPEWAEAGRNLAEIGGLDLVTMFTLDEPELLDEPPAGG
ncbi:MAG: ethyl tert-butyl ether degradation protein EthD [Actinomycetales bacterium]|nr:MAG: ethyl tert-butyl ether degradation protein EthD [Actinomycetales bacterium]